IRPVEQTAISPAESSRAAARRSAVACVSWKPAGPVQALAPPGLSPPAGPPPPAADDLTGPCDGAGLHPVAGEDGRGGAGWSVVDDDRDVPLAGRLEAGRHA